MAESTMKAVVFHQHGGPEQLRFEEVEPPRIQPDEVLVRVKACALNHLDIWIRQGIPAYQIPLPHIGGCDVAGVVERVAGESTGLQPGDRVFVAPGLSCWRCEFCLSGRDNLCISYRILGAQVDGGLAEFVKVPALNVIPIPSALSFEQAAAFPLTGVTAWHMLFSLARLQPAEDVLVLAAGSGVGSMAVQMAKAAGARVITTVGSDDKVAKASGLGADVVLNHTRESIADGVKRATGGRGVDVVIEHIGPATWEQSLRSLAKAGRLVTCGPTPGPGGPIGPRHLYQQQTTVMGPCMGTRHELRSVAKWIGEGAMRGVDVLVL